MIRDGFSPSTLLSTAHLTVTVNSLWGRGLWEIGWFRRAKLNPLASVHQWPRLTCGRARQPRFPNSSRSSRQPTRRRATVEANTARLMRGARAWEEGCRQFRALKLHELPQANANRKTDHRAPPEKTKAIMAENNGCWNVEAAWAI